MQSKWNRLPVLIEPDRKAFDLSLINSSAGRGNPALHALYSSARGKAVALAFGQP
jgi:hypothetical protein